MTEKLGKTNTENLKLKELDNDKYIPNNQILEVIFNEMLTNLTRFPSEKYIICQAMEYRSIQMLEIEQNDYNKYFKYRF